MPADTLDLHLAISAEAHCHVLHRGHHPQEQEWDEQLSGVDVPLPAGDGLVTLPLMVLGCLVPSTIIHDIHCDED